MRIAKENETKEMLEKNLSMLPQSVKSRVLGMEKESKSSVYIEYNKDGYPVCRVNKDGKTFCINGGHPIEEAKTWCDAMVKEHRNMLFVFGSGFGYPLFELQERIESQTKVLVFEQSLALFYKMLCYFDLTPLLQNNQFVFLVGECEQFSSDFARQFFKIVFGQSKVPPFLFTYEAQRNLKNEYKRIYQFILKEISVMIFCIGNDHQDNLSGFCNLMANVKEIVKWPYLSCLKDRCKGLPAFIISNGPSLDKNINELKAIKKRGLIIAVESAILPLLKHGIKPDILAVIERHKNTYQYHFKDNKFPEDMALLSLAVVNKHVYPSFAGPIIPMFRKAEEVNEWVCSSLGDGTSINAGANVSHLATEIAVYLGANPIVFIGQDFAYGTEGVTHSVDSLYSEERGKKLDQTVKNLERVYVEGNNQEKVVSNKLWCDFRIGLENKIISHPDKTFINATEGGAKIEGTVCHPLSEVISEYCVKPYNKTVASIIKEEKAVINREERLEKLKKFIESVEEHSELFYQLVAETRSKKAECRKMIRLSKTDYGNIGYKQLETVYQNNIKVLNKYIDRRITLAFIQQALYADYYYINCIGNIDNTEKITDAFNIQYQLFNHLNMIFQSVMVHFEQTQTELKKVLEEFKEEGGCDENEQH